MSDAAWLQWQETTDWEDDGHRNINKINCADVWTPLVWSSPQRQSVKRAPVDISAEQSIKHT